VENMAEIETNKNGGISGNTQKLLGSDEEEDRYVAMKYEKIILRMLTK